jgi:hypothetical protein
LPLGFKYIPALDCTSKLKLRDSDYRTKEGKCIIPNCNSLTDYPGVLKYSQYLGTRVAVIIVHEYCSRLLYGTVS